jgi:hypothetical protein
LACFTLMRVCNAVSAAEKRTLGQPVVATLRKSNALAVETFKRNRAAGNLDVLRGTEVCSDTSASGVRLTREAGGFAY